MVNADVMELRSLYEAFNRRDVEAMAAILDPDLEIVKTDDLAYAAALLQVLGPRFMILSGGYRGVDEAISLFRTIWEIAEWFEVITREFVVIEDFVVVPLTLRAKSSKDGREGMAETAHLWQLENGRPRRLQVFVSENDAVAAAMRLVRARSSQTG